MYADFHHGQLPWDDRADRLLAREQRRFASQVRRYELEPASMSGAFYRAPDGGVEARMSLQLPDTRLEAHVAEADAGAAIREAAADLGRQFDALRMRLSPALRARAMAQARARREQERVLLPPGSPAILHLRAEVVREGLAVLERAALHELAWHQAEGRVEPGLLDPEELAEKVMVRELPKLAPHDKPVAVVLRLRRQVVAEVRAAVERLLLDPTHVLSMDQRVPSQPEALQVSPLGGELLDYWQPDETLSLQDVLGTSPEDPASVVSDIEGRHALVSALFSLPEATRRLVEQHVLDGFSADTVAAHEQLDPVELASTVDLAMKSLSGLLSDDEAVGADEVRELYVALGAQLRDERAARSADLARRISPA